MNVNNLVINRMSTAILEDKTTSEMLLHCLEVKDGSLECSGEQVYATGAVGQKIAAFDRNKEAKITMSSSFFDLNLIAAEAGTEKVVASETNKIIAPKLEVLTATAGKATLSATPVTGSLQYIYSLYEDGSTKDTYKLNATASETEFVLTDTEITLPTDAFKDGDKIFVKYETEVSEGVSISNIAKNSARSGRFTVEVFFVDPCDQNIEYKGYVIFPNAKLTNEATIEFDVESAQSFTFEAMQDYCDAEKKLYQIIVCN